MNKASDTQVGGDHYRTMGDFQPWDVLKHWLTPEEYRGYQKGVAIAYLARERQKGGDQDIAKAAHHLQKLVEVLSEPGMEVDPRNFGPGSIVMMSADGLPIIDQPTDCRACCGQPNTCETPCIHRVQQHADADGWIDWTGGECPVPASVPVAYRIRSTRGTMMALAGDLKWDHVGSCDIIAYRVLKP